MTQPAGASAAPLVAAYAAAWKRVQDAESTVADGTWADAGLRRLARRTTSDLDALDARARAFFRDDYRDSYRLGAQGAAAVLVSAGVEASFAWSGAHLAAVGQLANDHLAALLSASQNVRTSLRRLVLRLTGRGTEPGDAGRLPPRLRPFAARYADGSLHGLAEVAAGTLADAATLAWNAGTVNLSRDYGVEKFEVSDGTGDAACAEVDGTVVDADWALSNLLAHRHCQRQFSPVAA